MLSILHLYMNNNNINSFNKVIFLIFSFIFLVTGLFLVFFVEKLALITLVGVSGDVTQFVQQFLGSAYILIGSMFYALRDSNGKSLFVTLTALNVVGFIHLYLLFNFHVLIILPTIYFSFQILMQLISIFLLIGFIRKA